MTHRFPRVDRPTLLLALIITLALAWLSLARYQSYNNDMWDLGNMAQPIWSVFQGRPLERTTDVGNISRLSIHVEWIYLALVPLYALWADARLLLVVQALLFGLGAFPAFALGRRLTGSLTLARLLALAYLLYPAAQSGVLADFHGDTLAMPLLLFALAALEARRWRAYGIWLALALACKVYVAVPVAVLGAILWLEPETRRVGWWTMVGAGLYGIFAFVVVRPFFKWISPATDVLSGGSPLGYLRYYFSPDSPYTSLDLLARAIHGLTIFGAILPLVWRAWRPLLPGLVVAAAALVGTGPASYHSRSHHYALVVPFIIWALAHALRHLQQRGVRPQAILAQASVSVALIALTSLFLLTTLWHAEFAWQPRPLDGWLRTPRDHLRDEWLARHAPPVVPLVASPYMTPHLVNRSTIVMLADRLTHDPLQALTFHLPELDHAIADLLFDYTNGKGAVRTDWRGVERLLAADFGVVAAQDGLLTLQRPAPPGSLAQRVRLQAGEATPPLATFGDEIALLRATVEPLGGRRYRLTARWAALRPLAEEAPRFAVSQLAGVEGARLPHLPTMSLLPTPDWPMDAVVEEQFEFELPATLPPGSYPLQVGWYDSGHDRAAWTEADSQLGEIVTLGTIKLP